MVGKAADRRPPNLQYVESCCKYKAHPEGQDRFQFRRGPHMLSRMSMLWLLLAQRSCQPAHESASYEYKMKRGLNTRLIKRLKMYSHIRPPALGQDQISRRCERSNSAAEFMTSTMVLHLCIDRLLWADLRSILQTFKWSLLIYIVSLSCSGNDPPSSLADILQSWT